MIFERRDGEVSVVCDGCGGRHRRKYPNRDHVIVALCMGGSLYEAGWRHSVCTIVTAHSKPVTGVAAPVLLDLEAVRCPTCLSAGTEPRWAAVPGQLKSSFA